MALDRTHQYRPTVEDDAELAHIQDTADNINNLKDNTVDLTTGEINSSSVTIDADATVDGDRSLIFKITDTILRIFRHDSATGRMRLEDENGDLFPLDVGDAAQSTQAATKGQLDTAQTTLQSNIDNLVIDETGDITFSSRSTKDGWVLMCGRTIGSAASGASERANADCENLFLHLWTTYADAEAPVTGGRGASAAADWGANKKIGVPDARGRNLIGLDNMGGSAASRVTSASTNGAKASVMGGAGGSQTNTIAQTNLPAVQPNFKVGTAGTSGQTTVKATGISVGNNADTSQPASSAFDNLGSGTALNNMPPFMAFNVFMKL